MILESKFQEHLELILSSLQGSVAYIGPTEFLDIPRLANLAFPLQSSPLTTKFTTGDCSVDCVLSIYELGNTCHPDLHFSECARILRPKGRLLIFPSGPESFYSGFHPSWFEEMCKRSALNISEMSEDPVVCFDARTTESIEELHKQIDRAPRERSLYLAGARLSIFQGKFSAAIAFIEDALELDYTDAELHQQLATLRATAEPTVIS